MSCRVVSCSEDRAYHAKFELAQSEHQFRQSTWRGHEHLYRKELGGIIGQAGRMEAVRGVSKEGRTSGS